MATAALLSQHSSNPLEVSSSDIRNRTAVRKYREATKTRYFAGHIASSAISDALSGFHPPELEQYHDHLATLYPDSNIPQNQSKQKHTAMRMVDLDEDMPSEPDLSMGEAASEDEGYGDEDAEGEDDPDIVDGDDVYEGTDEEMTLLLKSNEEQQEIQEEIAELEAAVPQLSPDYKILDRLGTGTFSSVYKALDLGYHDKWDNAAWHGTHPPSSSAWYQSTPRPPSSKVFVAVKRIYVTSGPERIRNELAIMEDCRMCRHISQIITAFRHQDQVVAIMPFHRNEDFRDYYRVLPLEGIKQYFRCLFRAFRDIHARQVIHRDVKPANFLFDPRTGIGTLCDFGLACRMERGPKLGACLHTAPTRAHPHGRIKPPDEYDINHIKKMQKEARLRCNIPSDKVGYPEKDNRPHSKANRAGTRGFRAPEVLLKCGEQTGAIDMWSAGMILLFFLTKKFPLFQSSDDIEALMEIASIVGRKRMEKTATLHNRVFQTNVPSVTNEGITWREFVEKLNPDLRIPPKPDPRYYPYTCHTRHRTRPPDPQTYAQEMEHALDLVEQLMHPESVRRITPRKALYHPFLRDEDEVEDDEFFPHPFGEGICAEWHFLDPDTEEPCVRVFVNNGRNGDETEVRRLCEGEGIAIGKQPCEFHKEEYGYMFS
ncbi:unnamed protein product [Somion occarium]|uniref:non-specific serine/threonine protein kinase n=1 Tax=Somion occarium TaxID=3059160 RepID=A0ABP1D0X0_9APHY